MEEKTNDLSETVEQFLLQQEQQMQPSTLKRYRYDLNHFSNWLQDQSPLEEETFSTQMIVRFHEKLLDEDEYAATTIRRIFSVLKQFITYADPNNLDVLETVENILQKEPYELTTNNHSFFTASEIKQLFRIIDTDIGLSEHQQKYRPLLTDRNRSIILLIVYYGLSVQELVQLTMKDLHFARHAIIIQTRLQKEREIQLHVEDQQILYRYYQTIPEPVRPAYYSEDPFFVAFDYQRGTFRWDYEVEGPKGLSEVAIQKMIRNEMKRAGIYRKRSARQLRHSYILQRMIEGASKEALRDELAFVTTQPLDRYESFIVKNQTKLPSYLLEDFPRIDQKAVE
ncbi:tyrosine-type recombinase/integrase [Texcoconibacillus texcoconensis]|uniref:Site-specific recombinase XerD n=1 Tax=Texcoconibacillus texcoconensis TaxID=1095777 RepID=A0A840QIZ3_9BACI|nr:site-specific integrase [Texcoconibacillus texcoconensis]MBB5171978.1 site-specific recombinase XerD [Texcoconibacillus texcoconensis]